MKNKKQVTSITRKVKWVMKILLFIASVLGALSVILGAFGTHAMKNHYSEYAMMVFEKGVRYQLHHTLVIFIAALAAHLFVGQSKIFINAGWLFVFGILIFSGSLYAIAFTGIKTLGAVTPLGGVSFIVAWSMLAFAFFKLL